MDEERVFFLYTWICMRGPKIVSIQQKAYTNDYISVNVRPNDSVQRIFGRF